MSDPQQEQRHWQYNWPKEPDMEQKQEAKSLTDLIALADSNAEYCAEFVSGDNHERVWRQFSEQLKAATVTHLSTIEAQTKTIAAMREALEDVKRRIKESDEWWMQHPDRGGFDTDLIDRALAQTEGKNNG